MTRRDVYLNSAGSTTQWRNSEGTIVTQHIGSGTVTVRYRGSSIEVPNRYLRWLSDTLRDAADQLEGEISEAS